MSDRFSIVCLSSEDWDSPLPTNRQQIMRRAAARGHDVLFVETNGWLGRHVRRAVANTGARRRLLRGEPAAPGIVRRTALNVLPWGQRFAAARAFNARCTGWLIGRAVRRLPSPHVVWVYDPAATPRSRDGALVVYDCVDDYAEQVGDDPRRRSVVSAADERAARTAGLVFTTARPLFAKQRERNPRTHLVPNVADYDHFAPAADRTLAAPETAELARPVLGFAGNLTPAKVDFDVLRALADARPDATVLLVGPSALGAEHSLHELCTRSNVHWLGPRPYEALPAYVAAFDVALIPYRATAYTRSCFPLKLYEYLAAGKPVLATGLPELAGLAPDVVLAAGAADALAAAEQLLGRRSPVDVARRQALAASQTWDSRAGTLLELVGRALAG
jgi:glycosyltransferase involved in cell wall biosynthesis